MEHMELLYHFYNGAWSDVHVATLQKQDAFLTIQVHALKAPYLLHQMLAVSALYLSITRPEKQAHYKRLAESLHARALSLVNEMVGVGDPSAELALLMFSSLVGIQMLCDTLRYRKGDLDSFLEAFVQYSHIHRDVKIVADTSKHLLEDPSAGLLSQLCDESKSTDFSGEASPGPECAALRSMLTRVSTKSPELEACRDAIDQLQNLFDASNASPTVGAHMIFAWATAIPPEFVGCLTRKVPEAFVILAYYAGFLHRHSGLWVVGDGATFLIKSISDLLMPEWNEYLVWPISVMGSHPNDQKQRLRELILAGWL